MLFSRAVKATRRRFRFAVITALLAGLASRGWAQTSVTLDLTSGFAGLKSSDNTIYTGAAATLFSDFLTTSGTVGSIPQFSASKVVIDLGDLGSTPLNSVILPAPVIDSTTIPVSAVAGHTYAALAPSSGTWDFTIFKVTDVQNNTSVSFDYVVTTLSAGNRVLNVTSNTTLNNASGVGAVAISSGQTVTVNLTSSTASRLYGDISGAGALNLVKSGSGFGWYLLGDATHTGGTTVSAGTSLNIGDSNSAVTTGSIAGDIVNNGILVFGRRDGVTYGGSISGTGSVSKSVAGDLTFTGNNTYSGGTTVSAGRLITGAVNTLSPNGIYSVNNTGILQMDYTQSVAGISSNGVPNGIVNLANSTVLTIGNALGVNFFGVIQGSGSLVKSGTGTQILSGNNTFTGTTTVTGGTLQLGNGGTTGSVAGGLSVSGAGSLAINRSDNFTLPLIMSGTGAFTKSGVGTLTLTGNSTHSGNTLVSAGILATGATNVLSPNSNLIVTSVLEIDHDQIVKSIGGGTAASSVVLGSGATLTTTNTGTFLGVISGAGSLNVTAGVQGLRGINTYTGGTTVSGLGAKLRLGANGTATHTASAINTTMTVSNSGELTGNGSVGAVVVNNGGLIGAGFAGTGTLTTGNETWNSGGIFRFQINDALGTAGALTGWDLLTISGALNINATAASPFVVSLESLTTAQAPGAVANFIDANSYSWKVASTTGGITGFDSTAFTFDSDGISGLTNPFTNSLTGTFSLSQAGNDLYLNYTAAAIPEPSVCTALTGLGALILVLRQRRGRGKPVRPN